LPCRCDRHDENTANAADTNAPDAAEATARAADEPARAPTRPHHARRIARERSARVALLLETAAERWRMK
jgi:hypothetical protein